jgi:hypothetical protein
MLTVATGMMTSYCGYYDMITFILKRTSRLYLDSVLDVIHIYRKVMR